LFLQEQIEGIIIALKRARGRKPDFSQGKFFARKSLFFLVIFPQEFFSGRFLRFFLVSSTG